MLDKKVSRRRLKPRLLFLDSHLLDSILSEKGRSTKLTGNLEIFLIPSWKRVVNLRSTIIWALSSVTRMSPNNFRSIPSRLRTVPNIFEWGQLLKLAGIHDLKQGHFKIFQTWREIIRR